MGHPQLWAGVLLVLLGSFIGSAQAAGCVAQSGADTVALVELYTSKRCAGCARAEHWLSTLRALERVLPVLLHIDERDYSGEPQAHWPRRLTLLQRLALVHKPQVLVQGLEFPAWGTPAFDAALAEINARPAQAQIRLEIVSIGGGGIEAQAAATVLRAGETEAVVLYLAAYANRPGGALVQEWQGPFAIHSGMQVHRTLPFPPGTAPNRSGVLGFVQDQRTAEVLQALRLPSC